jgi:hypothetical protein
LRKFIDSLSQDAGASIEEQTFERDNLLNVEEENRNKSKNKQG